MSGSLKDFVYSSDAGTQFLFRADESNTEAVNGTGADYTGAPEILHYLPKNLKPRRATYKSADGLTTRVVVVATPAIFASLPTSIDVSTVLNSGVTDTLTLFLISTSGESLRRGRATDTGKTDGDLS